MDYDRSQYENDVFISYSSKQTKEAYLIRDVLSAGGLSTWMAPDSIPSGSDYTTEIPRAIEGARVVVLVLSSEAQSSDWVTMEIKTAIRNGKDIIPFAFKKVKIEDAFDTMLSRYQRIDAYRRLSAALAELVDAVCLLINNQNGKTDETFLKARLKKYRRRNSVLAAAAVVAAIGLFVGMSFVINNAVNTARENAVVTQGVIGECEWNYEPEAAALTISGNGSAAEDSLNYSIPWSKYIKDIRTLKVEEGVTVLSDEAFSGATHLSSVTLPKSLTKIGGLSFGYCSALKEITLPENLTTIGLGAFTYCTSLEKLSIPASVTELGDAGTGAIAFTNSGLKSIEVDDKNTRYASLDGCLYNKKMTKLLFYPPKKTNRRFTIPENVTEIGHSAFSSCRDLIYINFPDSVTHIAPSAFAGCSALRSVELPEKLIEIGDHAFYVCSSLESVKMNNNVGTIGKEAFSNCTALTEILLSKKLGKISESMLQSCTGLEVVYIPDGIESIDKNAFRFCSSLGMIRIPSSVVKIDAKAFDSNTQLIIVGSNDTEAQRFADENGLTFNVE